MNTAKKIGRKQIHHVTADGQAPEKGEFLFYSYNGKPLTVSGAGKAMAQAPRGCKGFRQTLRRSSCERSNYSSSASRNRRKAMQANGRAPKLWALPTIRYETPPDGSSR